MKMYAPKYYKDFVCIADKCSHSCCIGWEIDIDKDTMNKYMKIQGKYGEYIKSSIENDDAPHFKLTKNDRCPHLNEKGLCNIILNYGDDYICDICREHPRFYNFTNHGKEVGIGMSCEEACRLILCSDNFDEIVEIGEVPGDDDICDFDAIAHRERIYITLKDSSLSYDKKLNIICSNYSIEDTDEMISNAVTEFEYLYSEHKILFTSAIDLDNGNRCNEEKLIRILAYFIYRHCSEACNYDEFRSALGFSVACTRLITSLANEETIQDIARIVSEEIEYSEENSGLIKGLF